MDGANAARDFLKRPRNHRKTDIDTVWTAIALHTTPGIPNAHASGRRASLTAGVEMDVLGLDLRRIFRRRARARLVKAYPSHAVISKRTSSRPSMTGSRHKPETTFGNVKADVLADKDPHFHRGNFCVVIDSQIALAGLTAILVEEPASPRRVTDRIDAPPTAHTRVAANLSNQSSGVLVAVPGFGSGTGASDARAGVRVLLHDEADRFGARPLNLPFDHRGAWRAPLGVHEPAARRHLSIYASWRCKHSTLIGNPLCRAR